MILRPFLLLAFLTGAAAADDARPTMASVLEASEPADWRPLQDDDVLYLQLASGRVVVEMAPAFAPQHVANVRQLVRDKYFDGLAIVRSQDNYVAQWGDPESETDAARPFGKASATLPAEFFRDANGVPFHPIDSRDAYAKEVGFVNGFPAARDSATGDVWLLHCYGMVGVGRDTDADSGNGSSLYVVTGHAPRHLDRNVTLIGRVIDGMELLTTLPRGTGPLGFYESAAERVPLRQVRLGSELPKDQRLQVERLRTDTETFDRLVASRRYRAEDWFANPVDAIEVCNVPLPSRPTGSSVP